MQRVHSPAARHDRRTDTALSDPPRHGTPAHLGLSAGEASALVLGGAARSLWGEWLCPGDTRADLTARTDLLRALLAERAPADAVVAEGTAAWAWLGGTPPAQCIVRVRRIHRSLGAGDPPLRAVEGLPPERHIVNVGRLRISSPLRAAVELLAVRSPDRAASPSTVRGLLEAVGAWTREAPPPEALEGFGPAARSRIAEGWTWCAQAFR
ncbi:hypothetical protein [Galactobacter valiniphilus]|uniref:hypothetical protein n=1 Tax=Galactobacter valiniphilus TaxID=2676122 RepID=UPI0037356405